MTFARCDKTTESMASAAKAHADFSGVGRPIYTETSDYLVSPKARSRNAAVAGHNSMESKLQIDQRRKHSKRAVESSSSRSPTPLLNLPIRQLL